MTFRYRALGLDILAPFACSGFWPVERATTGREIVLELGSAPLALEAPICVRPLTMIDAQGTALHRVPGVARYLISERRRIVIDLAPGGPLTRAIDYLRGTPLAILCLQHGLTPLAAASVRVGDKALLLGGAVNAGRSTMALALTQQGHRLMADDICALDVSNREAGPRIWPSFPEARIWPETLAALNLPASAAPPTLGGRLIVAAEPWFEPEPWPVDRLVILLEAKSRDGCRIERPRGAMKFESAMNLQFIQNIAKTIVGVPTAMAQVAPLASLLEIREFQSPFDLQRIGESARRALGAFGLDGEKGPHPHRNRLGR